MQVNLGGDSAMSALIDLVSNVVGVNIIYDQDVGSKRIVVKAPNEVPVSSLMGVLESALKTNGLAVVDTGVPGWKRIVKVDQLPNYAPTGEAAQAIQQFGRGTAVTQAFVLKHADPKEVDALIKPFLTREGTEGANSVVVPRATR